MRTNTRQIARSGVMSALGVVCLCLGGIIPFALYACPILASLVLLVVREECRPAYQWCSYVAVAVLGLLLGPDKDASMLFCFLGWYPLMKIHLDAIPGKVFCWGVKIAIAALSVGCMYALAIWVLRLSSVVEELDSSAQWILWTTVILGLLLFIVYDVLLGRAAILYRRRHRKH